MPFSTFCELDVSGMHDLDVYLGASSTVHDRYQQWVEQAVFERMWQMGLKDDAQEVGIDRAWMAMDGAMVKAPLWGKSHGCQSH